MNDRREKKTEKHICIGILAHVDAGKTTLSEALLYQTGVIRRVGRVDHGDAYLDMDAQEKERGITIFSKEALFPYGETSFVLLDTPGHVDFSAEMERTLQVLDYAVLVIGGKDGVQGHTVTLWRLLDKYDVPIFVFINKMDLEGADQNTILRELKHGLDEGCVDFSDVGSQPWMEEVAMCDEALLEEFMENAQISRETLRRGIARRKVFPCFFGSALKMEGVDGLLDGLSEYVEEKQFPVEFGARVYKITRDGKGNRLTHMKITGGSLSVKAPVKTADSEEPEKVEQIRFYSGGRFTAADRADAGRICAVTGLKNTYAGQGLGFEEDAGTPLLESVLTYQVVLPPAADRHIALSKLKQLEEEDPQLRVEWNEQLQEIRMQMMGQVQIEILKQMILNRFGLDVTFGEGRITYRETIGNAVIGRGHFEPLRHYSEVHLLMEPGRPGSGITCGSLCSGDELAPSWQRLIMSHIGEKTHVGVLTGSPITDIRISILAGKSHLKHTVPGDFRQSTYRAIRQGLRKAKSVLLEPWYEFRLELPSDAVGRAMSDIQKMGGSFAEPEPVGDRTVLTGKAPVSEMKDYTLEVVSYTRGHGMLTYALAGYEPCHDQERVIEAVGYDPDADLENTADSVFCSHGAGHPIRWDEADNMMHVVSRMPAEEAAEPGTEVGSAAYAAYHMDAGSRGSGTVSSGTVSAYRGTKEEDAELDRIFERTYGKPKQRVFIGKREILPEEGTVKIKPVKVLEEYLLVDGYNIIFAWDELKELAMVNMDAAREALIEILSNYQGYQNCRVMVVFDAYKVKGGERRHERHHNVDVIYTKEAETADMYIEKTAHEKSREFLVRVATSDRLEQMIIVGSGAFKVSADEFLAEVKQTDQEITQMIREINRKNRQQNRRGIVVPEGE